MLAHLNSNSRQILAALLLVTYGTAGVFGYGLHTLWHVHHHAPAQASSVADAGSCCGQCCSKIDTPTCCDSLQLASHKDAAVRSVEDDCSICAFLAQAQTPLFSFEPTEFVTELGQEIPVSEDISPLYIPADHLARGPPVC